MVLQRFNYNASNIRMVRDIQLKLLKTVAGSVFDSFQRWKTIPEGSGNYLRASKWEIAMTKFTNRYIKLNSWDPLTNVHEDA